MSDAHLVVGDCVEVVERLPENLVDAIVTDPPYHLQSISKRFAHSPRSEKTERYAAGPYGRHAAGFMGKTWDGGDVSMNPATWAAFLRVMKPGAHLLAFGGTRTHHRIWTAIEDAGFEVRDTLMWVYGSGFPKSHDAGNGWGTALKPAWEPIVLARKPFDGTVAANVLKHGTGALNIDGCRVGDFVNTTAPGTDRYNQANFEQGYRPKPYGRDGEASAERRYNERGSTNFGATPGPRGGAPEGRWPANLIHDGSDEVIAAFPAAPGQIARSSSSETRKNQNTYGEMRRGVPENQIASRDNGGSAARFFYCAKATRKDRDEGCADLPDQIGGIRSETSGQHITRRDGGDLGPAKNNHPTVKPTELMRYLCRLVTPPSGLILDPFTGSGSTGKAALKEGFRFLGIEKEAPYAEIARRRIGADVKVHYPAMAGAAE